MRNSKLTPAQIRTLQKLVRLGARERYVYLSDTRSAEALVRRGLVVRSYRGWWRHKLSETTKTLAEIVSQ